MKVPAILLANEAAAPATEALLMAARELGVFIIELPEGQEKREAEARFNEAIFWAQQALLRSLPSNRIAVATSLPSG